MAEVAFDVAAGQTDGRGKCYATPERPDAHSWRPGP
jgi:hypothetical protein